MVLKSEREMVTRRSFLRKSAMALGTAAAMASIPMARADERSAEKPAWPIGAAGDTQISIEHIGRWNVPRLNHILKVDAPAFTGFPVDYEPAENSVDLYRVIYPSVIPEQNNRPTLASGLIAIPENVGSVARLVSYQHGTVYGKQQVPSFPDQSPETQLMIAEFAGRGDILIGADYFGLGLSKELESYMVLGSLQQAAADMISAALNILRGRSIEVEGLYLAGWSEGGYVTMGLLERLESEDVPVSAAATASAPTDPFLAFSGLLDFPRPNDAPWINSIFVLSVFAYEHYYGAPGLARSFINPKYFEGCRSFYLRQPVDVSTIPTDLRLLIRPEYFNPNFFLQSEFGHHIHENQVFRWVIQTPTRNYYGESDEAITVGLGKLAMTYQNAMGNKKVEAISAGSDATHRGTFARAVLEWSHWFPQIKKHLINTIL